MTGLRFLRLAVLSAAVLALSTGSSLAQQGATAVPSSQLYTLATQGPDIQSIPVLQNIAKAGSKLFYLGERSGLHGWFIVKSGQIQMIYLTPDKKTALVGGMFTAEGDNVTSKQISELIERNGEVKTLLDHSARQEQEVMRAGEQSSGAASVPASPAAAPASDSVAQMPMASLSPGERLVTDLKAAAGVVLGRNDQAELYMIVAPGCPNCKKTWLELRDSVKTGKIQVRLIPVYNSTGDAEKNIAAQLLRVQDPMLAWDRFVEGDATLLSGTPEPVAQRAIMENLSLVAKWNIQGYPYLVYRGRDGHIKIVQGRPDRMAAVLTDLIK